METLNYDELKEKIKERDIAKEVKNAEQEIDQINVKIKTYQELKMQYTKTANQHLSFFKKFFSKKEYIKDKTNKNFAEAEITSLQGNIQQLETRLKTLNEFLLQHKKNKVPKIPESIQLDQDGFILISPPEKEILKKENVEINLEDVNKLMLVHCTNFLPKNKTIQCLYEGNKFYTHQISLEGVKKDIPYLYHRHTCHFTINTVVLPTSDGNSWNNLDYIILEPLESHLTQFPNHLMQSDSWTYGSVKLSDQAILIVREDKISELKKQNPQIFEEYNVMKYRGNYQKAVENLLQTLGYEVYAAEPNIPNHAKSVECEEEECLNSRDLALNYILDLPYNGKSKITISLEQLSLMYLIFQEKNNSALRKHLDLNYSNVEKDISESFLNFWIGSGIVKLNENAFTFKNDDEVYMDLKKLEFSNIDLEQIKNTYQKVKQYLSERKKDLPIAQLNTNLQVKDLYNFKNHDQARTFFQKIYENTNNQNNHFSYDYKIDKENGLILSITLDNSNEEAFKILSSYKILKETNVKNLFQIQIILAKPEETLEEAIIKINGLTNQLSTILYKEEKAIKIGGI